MSSKEYNRNWQKEWVLRANANGICISCCRPHSNINKRTARHTKRCKKCTKKLNDAKRVKAIERIRGIKEGD